MDKKDFSTEFKIIEGEFKEFLNQIRYEEDVDEYFTRLETEVEPLLNIEKPKIMVYGIYNSGKSTLINALCRQTVAEMADVPTTAAISEYDRGDYILVDSPGVDAPIEHERITEEHISKCHIILFVMSTKGGFEDKSNYMRMIQLIQKKIPFIIILNDRGYTLLKNDTEEQKRKKKYNHDLELIKIKYKVIENLKKYSKDGNISEKYEIFELNAKRGLKGVLEEKANLYASSNVERFEQRIRQILMDNNKLDIFKQPVNNILDIIGKIESSYYNKLSGRNEREFENKIRAMIGMKTNLMESMRIYTRQIVYSRGEEVMRAIYDENSKALEDIKEGILSEIQMNYEANCNELTRFINDNFGELGFFVNSRVSSGEEAEQEKFKPKDVTSWLLPKIERRNINFNENTGTSILPQKEESLLEIVLGIFKSRSKKEKEIYERMLAEAEAANESARHWVDEQIRLRQESKQEAYKILDDFQRLLVKLVNESLGEKFDNIERQIREENDELTEKQQQIKKKLEIVKAFEKRFGTLADRLL